MAVNPNYQSRIDDPANSPSAIQMGNDVATHQMMDTEINGRFYAMPTVVNLGGELVQLSPDDARAHNMETGNFKEFDSAAAASEYAKGGYKTKEFKDYYETVAASNNYARIRDENRLGNEHMLEDRNSDLRKQSDEFAATRPSVGDYADRFGKYAKEQSKIPFSASGADAGNAMQAGHKAGLGDAVRDTGGLADYSTPGMLYNMLHGVDATSKGFDKYADKVDKYYGVDRDAEVSDSEAFWQGVGSLVTNPLSWL